MAVQVGLPFVEAAEVCTVSAMTDISISEVVSHVKARAGPGSPFNRFLEPVEVSDVD
jgi:hypothetical protein